MKRYLLFAGLIYYPSGGWGDFVCDSDDLDEIRIKARSDEDFQWSHIVDTTDPEKDIDI